MKCRNITVLQKNNIQKYGKEYKISMQPIRTTFGNLENLKNELNLQIFRKNYSKNEIIEKLILFYNENGTISKELLIKNNYINHKVINRIWGNFQNMYKELFPTILEENRLTSKSCIAAILFINKILKEEPILEAKFDWLKNPKTNKNFRIDAYYEKHNIAIEFQGIQHYQFVKYFHKTLEIFEYKQKLDAIKKNLITSHNIKYIEIPYNFNQEQILNLININL